MLRGWCKETVILLLFFDDDSVLLDGSCKGPNEENDIELPGRRVFRFRFALNPSSLDGYVCFLLR